MKYKTEYRMLPLAELVASPYNPREDIERGSDEYKALRRSIEQHELVEPPVVNLHNMRCIGGNQRLTVLRDMGFTEVLCSVIDQPDEAQEKKLCLALNQIKGRWDTDNLGDLLRDDDVLEFETGFDRDEVAVYRHLEDAREPDINAPDDYDDNGEYSEGGDPEPDEDEDDAEDDGPIEEPTFGSTLIRIGHLKFKVPVSKYKRLLEAIRDGGTFDEGEIAKEMKRRLLEHD